MDATAGSGASAPPAAVRSDFGTGRLFLADARLAFTTLDYARYRALNRLWRPARGREPLTFVLALGAASAAFETTQRIGRAPFPLSRATHRWARTYCARRLPASQDPAREKSRCPGDW